LEHSSVMAFVASDSRKSSERGEEM